MSIIKVEDLHKQYRQRKGREGFSGAVKDLFHREYNLIQAVDGISFSVEKGEIIGYIGPNGAGKSTTVKMLVGILVPSSGRVEVSGLVPYKKRKENARHIGVVLGQRTQLWWDIPVWETLNLMRYIYDVPEKQYKENLKLFADVLELKSFIHSPVRQLSLGQRMRAEICCSLLHNPDILYLDEPTIGLDVLVKERVREFIKEINRIHGTTVILATHDMTDIESLCSRVMVINLGRVIYDGSLEDMRRKWGTETTIEADISGDVRDLGQLYRLGITDYERDNKRIRIRYNTNKIESSVVLKWLLDKSEVQYLNVNGTPIEEIIRKIYRMAA
jgi:ABC-2 type transport system ATP-binding protein